MARYKESVTVFKDANGKTMGGLSFLHFLGDLCQGFGLIFILGGISRIMDGGLSPVQIGIFAFFIVACFVGGSLLHKTAKQKAQVRYLESLTQGEKAPEETKQS